MATAAKTESRPTLLAHELPEQLKSAYEDLLEALTKPQLASWPDDETFHDALQPEAIGEVLIGELHDHLVNSRIGYLFRETIEVGGETKGAVASKCGGKLHYFSELDFLVEVNWTAWRDLTPAQRVALMDHELCHFGISETQAGETRRVILPHDVEEFSSIVKRWGLWEPALRTFHSAVNLQMGLFDRGSAVAVAEVPVRGDQVDSSLKELASQEADRAEAEETSGPRLHRDGGTPAAPRKKGKK